MYTNHLGLVKKNFILGVFIRTQSNHCKFCGKIHNGGFFDKLTGFFHKIFAIFKR